MVRLLPNLQHGLIGPATMETSALSLGPNAVNRPMLHHEVVGDLGSPNAPLVMVHGFGASIYSWRHLVPALGQRQPLILLDLKGFGKSPKPPDDSYSLFDQIGVVHDLLHSLEVGRLILLGHSFGGGVALALALRLREQTSIRLERLVLLDAISYRQRLPAFISLLRTPVIGELGTRMVPAELQVRCVLEQSYHDRRSIPPESVAAYAAPIRMEGGRHALIQTARQIVPPDVDAWSRRFREIDVPTLVVWGDDDRIVPIENGRRLCREMPAATLRVIPECGHIPQEEKPRETISALESFLSLDGGR
jgi:pimeloyl-ACP methyl ester carboxylesterase